MKKIRIRYFSAMKNGANLKLLFFLLLFAVPLSLFGQDPREFNHGVCVLEYTQHDSIKYYLTWSSSYNRAWEHDIYNARIYFDASGALISEKPDRVYIGSGSDEAQEPVNAAICPENNVILTVWEDGFRANPPNVKGQLHLPDGTILRKNWLIAGGPGPQHSANAAHLGHFFLVFYADEAPPAAAGAVILCKVLNDQTGKETQTLRLTPNDMDNWWPVSVSNRHNTRTLVVWGDGYTARGTVLFDSAGVIRQAQPPQDYLTNIQQYSYQVEWLEHLSQFLLIARNGAYENMTDTSLICLIDTLGNRTQRVSVKGGIVREAKTAVKWDKRTQTYSAFFPSGTHNLTQIFIDRFGVISPISVSISNHPNLSGHPWPSTGIWGQFIRDVHGHELFGRHYIALFVTNDLLSNFIIKIPVHLDTTRFGTPLSVANAKNSTPDWRLSVYPNPTTSWLTLGSAGRVKKVRLFNLLGCVVKEWEGTNIRKINLQNLPAGLYFVQVNLRAWDGHWQTLVQKIIKR